MTDVQLGITLLVLFVASLVGYGLGYRNGQISGELVGLKQRLAKKRRTETRQNGRLTAATGNEMLAADK